MLESGATAKVETWRLDVRRRGGDPAGGWGIVSQELMTTLEGLHRLSLNPRREIAVRDLVVSAEDLKLVGAGRPHVRGGGRCRRDGGRHPRPRGDDVLSRARRRADADEGRHRQRGAADAVRHAVRAPQSRRAPGACDGQGDDGSTGRPARHEARRRHLPPGRRQVVRPRSRRPERRDLVAAAAARGLPGRDPHAALRHAHLRALGQRDRGHLAVRPQAAAQPLGLLVQVAPGALRTLLQRGRPARLPRELVRRGRQRSTRRSARSPGRPAWTSRSSRPRSTCSPCAWPTRSRSSRSSRRSSAACCRCACATATASSWTCRGRSSGALTCTCWSPTRARSSRSRSTARPSSRRCPTFAGIRTRRRSRSRSSRVSSTATAATGTCSRRSPAIRPPGSP